MHYEYDRCIGVKIRQIRMDRGWTQEILSAKLQVHGCDMSRGVLANLEAGLRRISPQEIKAFKEIFGVSYDDLFV